MQKHEKDPPAKALYSQILDEIRTHILTGKLVAGARLPTEFELAKRYNASRGTVRQALSILVNEGLLERVQGSGTFVRETPVAQEPKTQRGPLKSIGVILCQANDELSMGILRGVEQAARPRGYQLVFTYTDEDPQEFVQDIARLRASTEGLIIFPISNLEQDKSIAALKDEKFPFVLVDRYFSELDSDYVVSDNLGGGYRATEHLLILGYTRIGFAYSQIGGLKTTAVRDRWEGYRKALRAYNQRYDETLIYHDLPGMNQDQLAATESATAYDEIMVQADRPDAIFAVNDYIASGLLQAAQRHGLRVPEDLALVGFDNTSYAALLSVPLTTVAQQWNEIGIRAGTLLINRIENGVSGAPRHIEVPTSLLVRQSCGARLRVVGSPGGGAPPSHPQFS